MAETSY